MFATQRLNLKLKKAIMLRNSKLVILMGLTPAPSLILPCNNISFKLSSNIKKICATKRIKIKSVYRQGKALEQHFKYFFICFLVLILIIKLFHENFVIIHSYHNTIKFKLKNVCFNLCTGLVKSHSTFRCNYKKRKQTN